METGRISEGAGWSPGLSSSASDKEKSGQVSVENHIAHRGLDHHPEATLACGFSVRFSRHLDHLLEVARGAIRITRFRRHGASSAAAKPDVVSVKSSAQIRERKIL